MPDIFGTDSRLGGSFKGTLFKLALGGGGGLDLQGALVQSFNLTYSRQLTRIWELGSTDQYYIEGKTEGDAGLQQIVGPKGLVNDLLKKLSDTCGADKRVLTLTAGSSARSCGVTGSTQLVLGGPVATSVQVTAEAQQFIINSGLKLMFTSLS